MTEVKVIGLGWMMSQRFILSERQLCHPLALRPVSGGSGESPGPSCGLTAIVTFQNGEESSFVCEQVGPTCHCVPGAAVWFLLWKMLWKMYIGYTFSCYFVILAQYCVSGIAAVGIQLREVDLA